MNDASFIAHHLIPPFRKVKALHFHLQSDPNYLTPPHHLFRLNCDMGFGFWGRLFPNLWERWRLGDPTYRISCSQSVEAELRRRHAAEGSGAPATAEEEALSLGLLAPRDLRLRRSSSLCSAPFSSSGRDRATQKGNFWIQQLVKFVLDLMKDTN